MQESCRLGPTKRRVCASFLNALTSADHVDPMEHQTGSPANPAEPMEHRAGYNRPYVPWVHWGADAGGGDVVEGDIGARRTAAGWCGVAGAGGERERERERGRAGAGG